jgi:hypothetical protein
VTVHDPLECLFNRLRRAPSQSSVPESLPILFFGDSFSARVATVGINPSDQEYLGPDGQELQGNARRFHTLSSLGASDRVSLNPEQAMQAIERMRRNFQPGNQSTNGSGHWPK